MKLSYLYEEYSKVRDKDSSTYISFYEKNKGLIDSLSENNNNEFLAKFRMTCEYGLSLVDNKNFVKASEVLEYCSLMIDDSKHSLEQTINNNYLKTIQWNYYFSLKKTGKFIPAVKYRLRNRLKLNDLIQNLVLLFLCLYSLFTIVS